LTPVAGQSAASTSQDTALRKGNNKQGLLRLMVNSLLRAHKTYQRYCNVLRYLQRAAPML
jgi:hypothetical protein